MCRDGRNRATTIFDGGDQQSAEAMKTQTGSSTRRGLVANKRANFQHRKTLALGKIKPTLSRNKRKAGLRGVVVARTRRSKR